MAANHSVDHQYDNTCQCVRTRSISAMGRSAHGLLAPVAAAVAAVVVAAVATTVSGERTREGSVFHPYAATGQEGADFHPYAATGQEAADHRDVVRLNGCGTFAEVDCLGRGESVGWCTGLIPRLESP